MANLLPAGLLARLIEESQDAVMVIDDRSILRYINKAACMLSGYEQSAVIGRPLALLLPATVAADHHDLVGRYIGSPQHEASSVLGRVREFTIVHASGEEIPVELKAVDLGRAEGTHYFGAFFNDLRERRRMEAHNLELLARLQRQALSDTLTGLPNRRAFQSQAQQLAARVKRSGEPATVAIADIDHFKSVNDRYGHPAGDAVLTAVAAVIRSTARGGDSVGRIGGEEFALLFPATPLAAAADVAERIRAAVGAASVDIAPGQTLSVTISIGLAPFNGDIKDAMTRADAALYRAKNAGRNRVERA